MTNSPAASQAHDRVDCAHAYYIKLGREGIWEASSIKDGVMRIGWKDQTLADINAQNWAVIEEQLWQDQQQRKVKPSRGVVTRDLNALKLICTSTSADIWITFHRSFLWWCRLADSPLEQDQVSKYRRVQGRWRNTDVAGRPLLISQLSGRLTQTQAFRATACRVTDIEGLRRLLNNQESEEYQAARAATKQLADQLAAAIRRLHPTDFETLVDLIFREAGWRRISVLGESMKDVDLELEEPITHDLYQVQVKTGADLADFEQSARAFPGHPYRKLYFIVHTPRGALCDVVPDPGAPTELIRPEQLATRVLDFGLGSNYARTGHGGHVELVKLLSDTPDHVHRLRFTVLRTLQRALTPKEVVDVEQLYKEKLGSRAFGLNRN